MEFRQSSLELMTQYWGVKNVDFYYKLVIHWYKHQKLHFLPSNFIFSHEINVTRIARRKTCSILLLHWNKCTDCHRTIQINALMFYSYILINESAIKQVPHFQYIYISNGPFHFKLFLHDSRLSSFPPYRIFLVNDHPYHCSIPYF